MLCIRFVRVLAFAILVFLLGSIGMDAKRPIAAPHSLPGFGVDQADRGPGMPALPITVKKWKELAPPVPETNPRRGPNVRLNAVLSPGSERLTEGLLWRIMKVDASKPDEDEQELIWSGGGAEPQLTLKPGRYYAEATFGLAKDGLEFELARDQAVTQVVSLNAEPCMSTAPRLPAARRSAMCSSRFARRVMRVGSRKILADRASLTRFSTSRRVNTG
jgi:hypothetical protein